MPFVAKGGVVPAGMQGRGKHERAFAQHLAGERCVMLFGLRGVGKTALLHKFRQTAEKDGWVVSAHHHEPMTRDTLIVPRLEAIRDNTLAAITLVDPAKRAARKTNMRLTKIRLSLFGQSAELEPLADAGEEIDQRAIQIIHEIGVSAARYDTGVVILLDEVQTLPPAQLRALLNAINYAQQADLPIGFAGTGLPSVQQNSNAVLPSAQSVVRFMEVKPLTADETKLAFSKAAEPDETFTDEALEDLVGLTDGYPFFIQSFGSLLWEKSGSPISRGDVLALRDEAVGLLDIEWFAGKVDGLKDPLVGFLFALADLGKPSTTNEIRAKRGVTRQAIERTRDSLLHLGLIFEITGSPSKYSFAIPHFAAYLRRYRDRSDQAPASYW